VRCDYSPDSIPLDNDMRSAPRPIKIANISMIYPSNGMRKIICKTTKPMMKVMSNE
jgi:hypothetical protein